MMYIGVVEDRWDPEQMGRVRVRVAGVHTGNIGEIPTETLPWATVMTPTTSASISEIMQTPHIIEGSWVVVFFTDSHFQNPVVIGTLPGKPAQKMKGDRGFKDPSDIYPLYLNEADTPFEARARRYKESSSYLSKKVGQTKNVPIAKRPRVSSVAADKDETEYERITWEEFNPLNDHVPQYPFNHVTKTESGIVEEFDDTPNNVRTSRFHPSGTYEEVYQDGSRAVHVEGAEKVVIKGKCDVYIANDANVTVNGNMTHYVIGDYKLEVTGDYTRLVHGSMQTKVLKNDEREIMMNRSVNIGENDKLTVGIDKVTSVGQNFTTTTGQDYFRTTGRHDYNIVTGDLVELISGDKAETNVGTLTITSKGNIKIETPSNYTETISGNQVVNVNGATGQTINVTNNIDMNATRIDLN